MLYGIDPHRKSVGSVRSGNCTSEANSIKALDGGRQAFKQKRGPFNVSRTYWEAFAQVSYKVHSTVISKAMGTKWWLVKRLSYLAFHLVAANFAKASAAVARKVQVIQYEAGPPPRYLRNTVGL